MCAMMYLYMLTTQVTIHVVHVHRNSLANLPDLTGSLAARTNTKQALIPTVSDTHRHIDTHTHTHTHLPHTSIPASFTSPTHTHTS